MNSKKVSLIIFIFQLSLFNAKYQEDYYNINNSDESATVNNRPAKTRVDKSYELFKNLITSQTPRNHFKLRCDFNVNENLSKFASNGDYLKESVVWYKVNLDAYEKIRKFDYFNYESLNKTWDNVYVKTHINNSPHLSNSTKLTSELFFQFNDLTDPNYLDKVSGIYLCKLGYFDQNIQTQYTQRVSVNEYINRDKFELNYTIVQKSNSRIILELYSILSNREHNTSGSNFKLIYSLANSINHIPILRGSIDIPNTWMHSIFDTIHSKNHHNKNQPKYVILEGLSSNTKFILSIYLQKYTHKSNQSTIRLILNETISTSESPFYPNQPQQSTTPLSNYDYNDEYQDEYGDDSSTSSSNNLDYADEVTKSDRIVNCDLTKNTHSMDHFDSNTLDSLSSTVSTGTSSFNLFNNNKKKVKNLYITINYSSPNMNKLIGTLLNVTIDTNSDKLNDISSNLTNFIDFFNLKQFSKDSLDYSIYYDCLKQYESNLKRPEFIPTKSLCLFNLASTSNINNDENFNTNDLDINSSNSQNDYFSIQTSLTLPNMNRNIYIASSCVKNKHQTTQRSSNLNGLNSLESISAQNNNQQFSSIVKKTDNLKSTTPSDILIFRQSTQKFLITKTSTKSNLKLQNMPITSSPNSISINDCEITPERDLRFKIDYDSNQNTKLVKHNKFNSNENNFAFYQIEITVPGENTEIMNNSLKDQKPAVRNILINSNRLHYQQPLTFNLTIRKEHNNSQIVKLNLSDVYMRKSKKLIDDEDEHLININNKVKLDLLSDEENTNDIEFDETTQSLVFQQQQSTNKRGALNNNHQIIIGKSSTLLPASVLISKDKSLKKSNSNDYVFKVRLISEDKSRILGTEPISVECKKMNNAGDSSNSFLGLIMTCICAVIIIIVGFLFCLIMKRKYGISPDYFRNFKNNLLFKANSSPVLDHNNIIQSKQQVQNIYQLQSNSNHHNLIKTSNFNLNQPNGSNNNLKNSIFNHYYEDNDAISTDLFEAYVQQMHVDGDFGFAQLYEEITASTKMYTYSSDISLLECNRMKNRYSNILTYDHSRVKISCDERDDTYGYINANYVDGYLKQNAYIATQGPMPNTFGDFWKMILEKNCSIIVMITNVKEKGRIKCDQYWPDEGTEFYGNIQVTHLHTISVAFYTKRIFTIKIKNAKKRCNSERLVYQYHFTDWPDHGVPYYILPVLTFIKKSSRANPELGGPIVVHCSAGVGRTGTYIVIDAMMKQIKAKSTVNIHTFLKHIRHQRNYLVQTEEQFTFIYDVLVEQLKSGETELTEHNYKSYINGLSRIMNEEGLKLIDRQFQLITEYKPKDYQISFSQLPYNLEKNRNQRIVPVNNCRVILSKRPGIDGSEYINASYLHGSSRQDEFIVTQYPTKETKFNFWQMVWDNNSSVIVVLNSDETESCELYWQPLGEVMKCDTFSVVLREENFDMDFVLRDFLLQSIDEDYEFNCKMITACYWPDSCTPIKSTFELINKVKYYRSQSPVNINLANNMNSISGIGALNNNGSSPLPPIIVHDLFGGYRAATFCALFTFQDLIQMENSLNVYELAKMYHLKRPEIWQNRNNIMFLYEAAECLFEEMHSNHQFQFKNFLNSNIENHFNMINLNFQNNNLSLKNNTLSSPIQNSMNKKPNGSLSLLPQQYSSSVTLPSSKQQRNSLSNSVIGTRLYNFQNSIQQSRTQSTDLNAADPQSTIPLSSCLIRQSKQELITTTPVNLVVGEPIKSTQTKSALIDMLPSFFTSYTSSNHNENSTGKLMPNKRTKSGIKSNKAARIMNSMKLKSASIKKALFNQANISNTSTNNVNNSNELTVSKEIVSEKKSPILMAVSTSDTTSACSSSSNTATESNLILPTIKLNENANNETSNSSPLKVNLSKDKINF